MGKFTQTAGTNSLAIGSNAGSMYLGYNAGDEGTYTLSGGQIRDGRGEYLGYYGKGHFIQTGGTNSTNGLSV